MDGVGSVERRCKCPNDTPKENCACRRSDVRYRSIPRVDGRRVQTATFGTAGEAKAHWKRVEAAAARGGVDPRTRNMLFRDWVEQWRQTRVVKPSTAAADRARLPHLIRTFGDLPLTSISGLLVGQWVADLVGLDYAPKTVRHLHALLSGILKMAVKNTPLSTNPCADTRLPELVSRERVFLDRAEVHALIDAHDEYWRPFPVTLVGTGLRWAEAVGLQVRSVNLARRELTVARTWTSTFGWQTPKSKSSRRTILLPDPVVDALTVLVAGRSPDEHVFTMPSGVPVHHGYRDRVWRRAVADAGLAAKAPTPHDLRHTHASLLIADGNPLTVIQRRLGHKSIAITSDVYGHIYSTSEELLVSGLNLTLGGGVPDTVPDGL